MKRVYVAGLFSRNSKGEMASTLETLANMQRGILRSMLVIKQGYAPFCPWLDFQYGLLGELTEEEYKRTSMAWLEVSDYLLVISGEGLGSGVDAEIARAKELGIPIIHDCTEIKEYNPYTHRGG